MLAERSSVPSVLVCCRDEFVKHLVAEAYSTVSLRQYQRTLDLFCSEVAAREIDLDAVDAATMVQIKSWS